MPNPFSTRFVRPGRVPFIFSQDVTAESLIQQLQRQAWRGAIVGPHGSGKSTLLETLIPAIEQAGRLVQKVALHDGERRLPADFVSPNSARQPGVVVVDGYEQLGRWTRWKLNLVLSRSGWGLLATTHTLPVGFRLPELIRIEPTFEVFQQLVERLLASQASPLSPEDIAHAYQDHPENLREALFTLYDLVERQRSGAASVIGKRREMEQRPN
ncbi:MAG: hypothetical protein IT427_18210 [Pirellulales bacterium]|nr:hypothetical protein [Pirellulales bacterium]